MINKEIFDEKKVVDVSFGFIYWVTLFMIIVSSIIYYIDGYLGGDLEGINYPANTTQLIVFTCLYVFGLFFSNRLSKNLIEFNLSKYILIAEKKSIFLISIAFSLLSAGVLVFGGVGLISRDVVTNRYAELFFAAFDPYFLIALMIYYAFLNGAVRAILYLLLMIYLILIVRSGFSGYLILILPILVLIIARNTSIRKVKILLFLSILTFPLIRFAKWIIVVGLKALDEVIFDNDLYINVIKGTAARFSAVSNAIYIDDNSYYLTELLDSKYLPFFQGYIGSFVHKVLFSTPVALNTLYLHQNIHETNSDSNSTFPLISYFSLDLMVGFFSLFYAFFLVFFISRFLGFIYGNGVFGKVISRYILFFVTFFYVFNGWFWAVYGVVQAILVFSSMLFIFGRLVKK